MIELGLLGMAAVFMAFAILINGSGITGNVVDEKLAVNGAVNGFEITGLDYNFEGNDLVISYSLKENLGLNQEMSVDYTLRDFSGNKIASGQQAVVLASGQIGNYRARLDMPKDAVGAFRLSLNVWNGEENQWVVEEVGKADMSVTSLAVAESTGKTGNAVLVLLILTFIILIVVLYLRRHNARTGAFIAEKRKLIPFEV